jgi:hypothetical protein
VARPLGSIRVEVTRNRIPSIMGALPGANSRAVGQTCFAFVAGWKQRAHVAAVNGGTYRNSITTDFKPGMQQANVFTNLDYPYWEEYGNRYRPGHPAFRPTFQEQVPLHPKRVAAEMQKAAR